MARKEAKEKEKKKHKMVKNMINKSKAFVMMLVTTVITCILLSGNASAGYTKLATSKFDLTGATLLGSDPGPSIFMWYNYSDDDRAANVTNPGTGLFVTDPLDVTGHYRYEFNPVPDPEHTNWTGGDEPAWEIVFNYTAARANTDGVVRLHLVLHNLLGPDNTYFGVGVGYIIGFVNETFDSVTVTTYNMAMNLTLTNNNITTDIPLTASIQEALANLTGNAYLAIMVIGHGGNQTGTGVGQLDMRGSGLYVSTGSGGNGGSTTTSSTPSTSSTSDSMNILIAVIVICLLLGCGLIFYKPKKITRTATRKKAAMKTVKHTRTPRGKKGTVSMWPTKHKKQKRNIRW